MEKRRDMTLSGQIFRFCVFFIILLLGYCAVTALIAVLLWSFLFEGVDPLLASLGFFVYGISLVLDYIYEHRAQIALPFLRIHVVRSVMCTALGCGAVIIALSLPLTEIERTAVALIIILFPFLRSSTLRNRS